MSVLIEGAGAVTVRLSWDAIRCVGSWQSPSASLGIWIQGLPAMASRWWYLGTLGTWFGRYGGRLTAGTTDKHELNIASSRTVVATSMANMRALGLPNNAQTLLVLHFLVTIKYVQSICTFLKSSDEA